LAQEPIFFCIYEVLRLHIIFVTIQRFYIGQTRDLDERITRHNAGRENYTSKGIPWELVWCITKESRSEAIILERKLKNLKQLRLVKFMKKYDSGIQNIQILEMFEKIFGL